MPTELVLSTQLDVVYRAPMSGLIDKYIQVYQVQ